MDYLFYFGLTLLSAGFFALCLYTAFKIGKKKGAKEYYLELSKPQEEIQ